MVLSPIRDSPGELPKPFQSAGRPRLDRTVCDAQRPSRFEFGQTEEVAVLDHISKSRRQESNCLEQLASVVSDAGDTERLAPVVARLRMEAPSTAATHYYAATLAYLQQRPDVAIREAEAALAADPSHARAQNILGAALAGVGQRDRARAAFTAALASDPRDPATYSNLAALELESGNTAAAHRYFAEALTIDPSNTVARDGLATVLALR